MPRARLIRYYSPALAGFALLVAAILYAQMAPVGTRNNVAAINQMQYADAYPDSSGQFQPLGNDLQQIQNSMNGCPAPPAGCAIIIPARMTGGAGDWTTTVTCNPGTIIQDYRGGTITWGNKGSGTACVIIPTTGGAVGGGPFTPGVIPQAATSQNLADSSPRLDNGLTTPGHLTYPGPVDMTGNVSVGQPSGGSLLTVRPVGAGSWAGTPNVGLSVGSSTTDNTTYALMARNTVGTNLFSVAGDGTTQASGNMTIGGTLSSSNISVTTSTNVAIWSHMPDNLTHLRMSNGIQDWSLYTQGNALNIFNGALNGSPITINSTGTVAFAKGAVAFSFIPTAPTAPAGDSSTNLATTAFVSGAYRLLRVINISTSGCAPAVSGCSATSYTPATGTRALYVEAVGGGGGGGGVFSTATGQADANGGGGSGGYSASFITSLPGSPISITIGAGGNGGSAAGLVGSATVFGSNIVVANGGSGAPAPLGSSSSTQYQPGGAGATAGTGDLALPGSPGSGTICAATQIIGATGGTPPGPLGVPTQTGLLVSASFSGNVSPAAVGYGHGGNAGVNIGVQSPINGGSGIAGVMRIWEYQ